MEAALFVRRWWRSVVVLIAIGLLASIPAIISALPVGDSPIPASRLLALIEDSASIPFSGLVESHGNLGLPDLPKTGQTSDLLGGDVRIRAWWAGPTRWRADQLSDSGEIDEYPTAEGSISWDSEANTETRVVGIPAFHEPTAIDLTPPSLARRLAAGSTGSTVTRIGAISIAGHDALGLRITPRAGTTVGHIDMWATPSGLPLRLSVTATGSDHPAVSTTFLSLNLGVPTDGVTTFVLPPGAEEVDTNAPDYVAAASQQTPLSLPRRLAGLPREQLLNGEQQSGVVTYGHGYALLTVIPVARDIHDQAVSALAPPVGKTLRGHGSVPTRFEQLPVFGVVVGLDSRDSIEGYLMVGTVGLTKMRAAAKALDPHPLVFR